MNNAFSRFSAAIVFGIGWILGWQQMLFASHLPGDSFTAAVILIIVILLQFVILGRQQASREIPLHIFFVSLWVGWLLLLSLLVAPLCSGKKMLQAMHLSIAGYQLSSSVLFELAVVLIVVGVSITALVTFKEPD